MSDPDLSVVILLAIWAAWSLTNISAHTKRTAAALERLAALAERSRR